jgi:P27 family predicted phage terminase small subunit
MPGPAPKDPAKRIRKTTRSVGLVKAAKQPPMPAKLCRQAQDAWRAYWADTVAGVMRLSDTALALRWVANVDRYQRLIAEADREPVVDGHKGQPRPNPLYTLALKIEESVKEDERQLGIGPLNRLRLGVALTETAKSLADLTAEADTGAEDPRVVLLRSVEGEA